MTDALLLVTSVLEGEGWQLAPLEGADGFFCTVEFAGGGFPVLLKADSERDQLMVYALYPAPVPQEHLVDMMVFTTLANYGLPIGNFELDLSDGELRFKSSLDCEGLELDEVAAQLLVVTPIQTMQVYFAAIAAVLDGSASPVEAIQAVEGGESG